MLSIWTSLSQLSTIQLQFRDCSVCWSVGVLRFMEMGHERWTDVRAHEQNNEQNKHTKLGSSQPSTLLVCWLPDKMLIMKRVKWTEPERKKKHVDEANINNNIFCYLFCSRRTYAMSDRAAAAAREKKTIKAEMKYKTSYKWKRERKIWRYLCVGTSGWRSLGVRRHFCFGFYRLLDVGTLGTGAYILSHMWAPEWHWRERT